MKGLYPPSFQNSAKHNRSLPKYGGKQIQKNLDQCLTTQISNLRIASSSSSRDTLEVVYEESDEDDTNSVFANDDELTQLINNNNNNSAVENNNEDIDATSAFISSSSSSSCCESPLMDEHWKALKRDLESATILIKKLSSNGRLQKVDGQYVTSSEGIQIYPMAGAFLGTCLGGPVGFLAGVKIGGLAAVGGGILGKIFVSIN